MLKIGDTALKNSIRNKIWQALLATMITVTISALRNRNLSACS